MKQDAGAGFASRTSLQSRPWPWPVRDAVLDVGLKRPDLRFSTEPPRHVWHEPATYGDALVDACLRPLQEAQEVHGRVPRAMQLAVLQQLHWYFTVDLRERAPTVALPESAASTFHVHVRDVMQYIDADTLELLDPDVVIAEVRHALLSYQNRTLHTQPHLDTYDHEQGVARIRYYVHGHPPSERFQVDGKPVEPAYAKYRACRFFHRTLLRQRIVWLPIRSAITLSLALDGMEVPMSLGLESTRTPSRGAPTVGQMATASLLLRARELLPAGKGGQLPLPGGWPGWKARMLKALARMPPARGRFAKAWVFIDREEDAHDSAEHLYRWVHEHYPHINVWFLLLRSSADWARLKAEGFRLVPPGLRRRLLILNSAEIISSHADYVFGGMDRKLYGDAMQWRYTFLQHGVIKDDVSHWLGPREFDRFVTSSPAEYASIVGDDTPYPYTEREVRRTGLPRHDRLLLLAARVPPPEINRLLVMPTWRAGLVDDRTSVEPTERMAAFASSSYARRWRELLRNEKLHRLASEHGLRVTFLPHANAEPYIEAFDLPAEVEPATTSDGAVQQLFARTAAFITDYTSVAFDMALLRRPVFYYQFDRSAFYAGEHNWRAGYFDYDRDGFGPVATTEQELVADLTTYFDAGAKIGSEYLSRMQCAMPDTDAMACQRTFDSIVDQHRSIS